MTRLGYTDITLLVDRSGSMAAIRSEMEDGFSVFVKRQRDEFLGAPGSISNQQKCLLTVEQFDSGGIDSIYAQCPITDTFSNFSIVPRGSTPLLDALGKTIVVTGERLAALPEKQRPDRVLFVVVTDGEENASQDWKKETLRNRITEQEKKFNWRFTFIGANYDNFREAGGLGVGLNATISGGSVYGLWTSTSSAAARYALTASFSYTEQERTASK